MTDRVTSAIAWAMIVFVVGMMLKDVHLPAFTDVMYWLASFTYDQGPTYVGPPA